MFARFPRERSSEKGLGIFEYQTHPNTEILQIALTDQYLVGLNTAAYEHRNGREKFGFRVSDGGSSDVRLPQER